MDNLLLQFKLWFDRILSKSLLRQLGVLAITLVVAFGLSYLLLSISGAEWQSFCEAKKMSRWLLPLYLLIDSNALNNLYIGSGVNGWMLFASSITFLIGAFIFNGAIIGIITNSIERRVSNHREGRIHYLKSGHYIIMGYDDMIASIITHIFEKNKKANILILSAGESQYIREKLRKVFDEDVLERIIINYGHRMSKKYYKDIHLESAEQIYIVGLRSLQAHDAINVECVDSICKYLNGDGIVGHPKRITCVFEDLDTYAAFKTSEIFDEVNKLGIEFIPYNFYTGWAKQVFVKRFHKDLDHPGEEIPYPAVFGRRNDEGKLVGIDVEDPRYVHLVFVGTTNFAVAFAMEAAHVLHFPNFKEKGAKTLITFIDKNADQEKDVFITRNRHFFEIQSYFYQDVSEDSKNESRLRIRPTFFAEKNGYTEKDRDFLDVEFEFIKGNIFSTKVQSLISDWAKDHEKKQYLSIFLAQNDQDLNFAFGMNMPDAVYHNEVPIFIRQDRSDNFVSNLRKADEAVKYIAKKNTYFWVEGDELKKKVQGGRFAHIYPFGMNETAYSADEKSLERAKLINYLYATAKYDENKFQSVLVLDSMSSQQIWAEADREWRQLSVALKWSNLYNAYSLRIKLASLRAMRGLALDDTTQDTWPLSEDEAEALARVEHNRWNVEKLLMGYRKPHSNEDKHNKKNKPFKSDLKRNKERFIHHDIRPYDALDDIKELDKEYSRYIPWIIRMTEDT